MATKGGKGSRARRKAARKAERLAKKASYKAMAEESRAKGIRRKVNKAESVANFKHQTSFCGNSACKRCFPELNPVPEHVRYAKSLKQIGLDRWKRKQKAA